MHSRSVLSSPAKATARWCGGDWVIGFRVFYSLCFGSAQFILFGCLVNGCLNGSGGLWSFNGGCGGGLIMRKMMCGG